MLSASIYLAAGKQAIFFLVMQSTQNYLWKTEDVLGQGATASVYKARNKISGELVAVKVFNSASYLRPQEVQIREFEVLRKLNHQNIVKLFAVEEIEISKQKVLVMEYCSGGSLLCLLEEPENAFGLSESEFLIVLHCVVSGMNHLRENGVVHRDLKPGNIMRLMGEDRQSIYKLSDFGAARELDDDEKFESVYGTEEYLHPDMYKRAVLKKPQQKTYGVTVDLWSIGVTFYHAATGSLPFIPFGGPRRNKEIIGLKRSLVPILANILEANEEECWSFDQFFAETNDILHRTIIHVFSLSQAVMFHVYIHPYNTATKFLEEVFRQTNTAPCDQEYFFEGHIYELEPSMQVCHFPKTTENCPLIMMSSEPEEPVGFRYRDPALEFPRFLPKVDVIADCSTAKGVLNATHQTVRISQSFLKSQELILRGLYSLSETLKVECLQILEKRQAVVAMLSLMQQVEMKVLLLYETVTGDREIQEIKGVTELKTRLQAVTEEISRYGHRISEQQTVVQGILSEVGKKQNQMKEDRSIQKMEACLDKMKLIYAQFKKARKCPRLSYNEQQIHKLDKLNLGHSAKKVISVFQDNCVQHYQAALSEHGTRMRKASEIWKHLKKLSRSLTTCSAEMSGCQDCLLKVLDELHQRILQDKMTSSAPTQVCLNQKHKDVVFGIQELQDQMKIVAHNLQLNNNIIQRLNGVTPGL
ncbi:hypothetical protein JD844_018418 [Phrynosoma platyrhinos]|uniref:Protein kinase domain-containing protein n=1 Tax=Phrynosoma platyrhinos TaxID=52577 RepID=A0ABQ7SNM9_PHRPL|nr:hypothetical protein JD844_018418 [Phrynosoma platyrhinos]